MQVGQRCNAPPSLAPDFVLLFWTLPEVVDLCRRRQQVQISCWVSLVTMGAVGSKYTVLCTAW